MKIGVLGGTFNPIHHGHLLHAENIRLREGLDKIIFIPSKNPPHKANLNILDFHERKKMVEIAISSNPYFEVSDIESKRQGPSYTIDTLEELKDIYPRDEIYLILGADSILSIESWMDYKNILSSTKILLVDRYVDKIQATDELLKEYKENYDYQIKKVKAPILDISSTEIRKRLEKNLSIKYYLPENVENYILENSLYSKEED